MSSHNILRVDASMRKSGSASRGLTDHLLSKLGKGASIVNRDLADGISLVNEAWIGANFTDPADRSDDQKAALAESDACVAELRAADIIIIGLPIYNFGTPAAFKAWIDMVCRARETFAYTSDGPKGLLENKKVFVAAVSGGTEIGGAIDFATDHVRHVLGFIGLTDVTFITADRLVSNKEAAMAAAKQQIDGLSLA